MITPFVLVLAPATLIVISSVGLALVMRHAREPRSPHGVQQAAVLLVTSMLLYTVSMQLPSHITAPGVDGSYPYVLNRYAFEKILFGTDLIYTYGPLGFLVYPELVGANLQIALMFWSAMYLGLAILLSSWIVASAQGRNLAAAILVATVALYFVDPERLLPCFAILLTFVGISIPRLRTHTLLIGCVVTALATLMKVTGGALCLTVLAGGSVFPLRLRETTLRLAIVFGGSFLATLLLWIGLYGAPAGLLNYFANTLEIVSGYSKTMAYPNPKEGLTLAAFLGATTVIAIVIWRLPLYPRWPTAVALALPLLVAWKHGVVRLDSHVAGFIAASLFMFLMAYVMHDRAGTTRQAFGWRLFALTAVLGLFDLGMRRSDIFWGPGIPVYGSPLLNIRPMSNQPIGIAQIPEVLRWDAYVARWRSTVKSNLAHWRLAPQLIKAIGRDTIDVYSYDLGFVAANPKLNFRLKPVFQHFNAFTSGLDRLNADFYFASTRPRYLLYYSPTMYGIDGRYFLYDDPIAQLEVLNRYRLRMVEPDGARPSAALLESTDTRRFAEPVVIGNSTVRWNESLAVPKPKHRGVLRAKVDIATPMFRRLKEAVFRLAPLYLVYELADGTFSRFRLVATHMPDGVWIEPYFQSLHSFFSFLGGKPFESPPVTGIHFETDNEADYAKSILVVWELLEELPGQPRIRPYAQVRPATVVGDSTPQLLSGSIESSFDSVPGWNGSIGVKLSTYNRVNRGTVTLSLLDSEGNVLVSSATSADHLKDNMYQVFELSGGPRVADRGVRLRLSYDPPPGNTVAAWRYKSQAEGFDYRLYVDR